MRFLFSFDGMCVFLNVACVFLNVGRVFLNTNFIYSQCFFCVSLRKVSFFLKVTWEEREPCCVTEVGNLLEKFSQVDSYINILIATPGNPLWKIYHSKTTKDGFQKIVPQPSGRGNAL